MCEYCEKDKRETRFPNGIRIGLGDFGGSILITNYIGKHPYSGEYQLYHQILHSDEKMELIEDEKYYPWNKFPYIGINYCPFCGRKLESE